MWWCNHSYLPFSGSNITLCGGVIIVIYRLVAGTSRSCVGVISYLPFSGSNITLCVDVIIVIYRLVAVTSRCVVM